MNPTMVERFLREKKEQGYSEKTLSVYRMELRQFEKVMNKKLHQASQKDIERYIYELSPQKGPEAKRRTLATFSSFFEFLIKHGKKKTNPIRDMPRPKKKKKIISYLSIREYQHVLELAMQEHPMFSLRDRLIIMILMTTGIRASELTNIKLSDIDLDQNIIHITRKGGDQDIVYINSKVKPFLEQYLKLLPKDQMYLCKEGYRDKLSRSSVYKIVRTFLEFAGIKKEKMGPHTLRHTFAMVLVHKNVSIYKIQQLMHHRNLATTERYLHVDDQDLRDVIEDL